MYTFVASKENSGGHLPSSLEPPALVTVKPYQNVVGLYSLSAPSVVVNAAHDASRSKMKDETSMTALMLCTPWDREQNMRVKIMYVFWGVCRRTPNPREPKHRSGEGGK